MKIYLSIILIALVFLSDSARDLEPTLPSTLPYAGSGLIIPTFVAKTNVVLNADGKLYVNGLYVAPDRDPSETFKEERKKKPGALFCVYCDAETAFGRVAELFEELYSVHIARFFLAVQPEGVEEPQPGLSTIEVAFARRPREPYVLDPLDPIKKDENGNERLLKGDVWNPIEGLVNGSDLTENDVLIISVDDSCKVRIRDVVDIKGEYVNLEKLGPLIEGKQTNNEKLITIIEVPEYATYQAFIDVLDEFKSASDKTGVKRLMIDLKP